MRRWQPTFLFSFTVLIGLARALAYAGTPLGQSLSPAALVHYVALHLVSFSLASFLVASLSRATATRAAQVALYAQFGLFLAPFVDVSVGAFPAAYETTYVVVGTPGAIAASLLYGAILAWGVRDATSGSPAARRLLAGVAFAGGVVGLFLVGIPWPGALVEPLAWGVHLLLAVYDGMLAALLLAATLAFANGPLLRALWRHARPWSTVLFSLLPVVGVLAAGRLALPPIPTEPLLRFQIEAPYLVASLAVAAALWLQWTLVRSEPLGSRRFEAAAVAKVVALATALLLGLGAFLAAGVAGSLVWLGRSRRGGPVLGAIAALAVLVGDLTVVAKEFTEVALGPAAFVLSIDPIALPSIPGLVAAGIVAPLVALGWALTNRTFA